MSTYEVVIRTTAGELVARFDVTEDDFKTTMGTLAVGDKAYRGIEVYKARQAQAVREMEREHGE